MLNIFLRHLKKNCSTWDAFRLLVNFNRNIFVFLAAVIPLEMTSPVKLLDLESFSVIDNSLEFLSEQSDFLVVGVVGYQGVGKSTILSSLANPKTSDQ